MRSASRKRPDALQPIQPRCNELRVRAGRRDRWKYALEALLGEGGMGAVFRARNTSLDMPVAIKLMRADLDRELLSGGCCRRRAPPPSLRTRPSCACSTSGKRRSAIRSS